MFNVIYSSEHDQYGCLPIGKPLPYGWHVVQTVATREAGQEWVWETCEMWDEFNAKMDAV